MINEVHIEKVVSNLLADYERRDGHLRREQVERLADKYGLNTKEIAKVYRDLADNLIVFDLTGEKSHSFEQLQTDHSAHQNNSRRTRKKLLSANEEVALCRQLAIGRRAEQEIAEGHPLSMEHKDAIIRAAEAREIMVLSNLGLVASVASQYAGISDSQFDDLFQEGCIGLLTAIEKFDHTLGCKFSTYATHWLMQAVTRAIADKGDTIRVPVHMHENLMQLRRAIRLHFQTRGSEKVDAITLAESLAWSLEKTQFVLQIAQIRPLSIHAAPEGETTHSLEGSLISEIGNPRRTAEQWDRTRAIGEALDRLTERERTVLRLRFGLDVAREPETLEQIGRRLNLTRERIRQIEVKALNRLRHPTISQLIHDFI